MIGSSRSYAIGMAHFQIAGGMKTLLLVCGVYLLLFGAGLSLFYYMDYTTGSRGGLGWAVVTVLLIFEAVVLIILGSFRVASAIRTDISSRMIESHRLMPVPGWRAVMGYLFGGTTHAITFAALNVVLAYIFAGVTSTDFMQVTCNQALLFSFAILVWTLTALGTLLFRHAYFIVMAALLVGGCVLVYAYIVLPGFALLISPLIGDSIFNFSGPLRATPWAYPASIGGQAALVALLFAGACRRYRGTYPTTFSDGQALLLMLAWCAISIAGLALWDGFHLGMENFGPGELWLRRSQLIASIAACMIFALIPISTIAARQIRRTISVPSTLIICIAGIAAVPAGILWAVGRSAPRGVWEVSEKLELQASGLVITALVAAAHVVTVYAALVLLRKMRPWLKWVIVGVGLLAYWVIPLILEVVRMMIERPSPEEAGLGMLGTLGPLGLLISTWIGSENAPSPVAGLVVQGSIAMVLGLGLLATRRGRAAAVAAPPLPMMSGMAAPVPVAADPVTADPPAPGSP